MKNDRILRNREEMQLQDIGRLTTDAEWKEEVELWYWLCSFLDSEWKSTTDQQKWAYTFPLLRLLPHPHNFLIFFSDQNLYILRLEGLFPSFLFKHKACICANPVTIFMTKRM